MDDLNFWSLGAFMLVVMAAACSGSFFKPGEWYFALEKPSWNPPPWVFGAVWSVLYLMIAIAGWLAWETAPEGMLLPAFAVFGVQLALNAAWSAVFFGMRRMRLAFLDLILLWLAVLANIYFFFDILPLAAWLLVPYLIWVTIAGALNISVLRLNKGAI